MSTRREFLKTLAKIGAVAAVPAEALQALMPIPAAPVTTVAPVGTAGALTLEMLTQLQLKLMRDRVVDDFYYFVSLETFEVLKELGGSQYSSDRFRRPDGVEVILSKHMAPNTWAEIPRSMMKF